MARSRKIIAAACRIFLFVILLFGDPAAAEEIRIGAIASLSGPAGEQGHNWLRGAELAARELRSGGASVRLLTEDDATQPMKAVSAFHKLTRVDKVSGIIGGTWDYLGEALYPLATRARIPLVTPTNPVEVLSPEALKSPFVFSNAMTLASERTAITRFWKGRGLKTVAIVYPSLPWGVQRASMLRDVARQLNIAVLFELEFPYDGSYLSSIKLAALKTAKVKPDGLAIVLDYQGLDLLTKELEAQAAAPVILTTQHLDRAYELSRNPERYRNVYATYPESVLDRQFRARFSEAYPGILPQVYAAEGYSAVKFLYHVIQSGASLETRTQAVSVSGISAELRLPSNGPFIGAPRAVAVRIEAGELTAVE